MFQRLRRLVLHAINHPPLLFATFAVSVATAGFFYSVFEDKSLSDGIWWAFVTICTVGYGDQFPVTEPGRLVGYLLMAFGIFVVAPCIIASILNWVLQDRDKFTHEEQERLMSDLAATRTELQAVTAALKALHSEVDEVEEDNDADELRDQQTQALLGQVLTRLGGTNGNPTVPTHT